MDTVTYPHLDVQEELGEHWVVRKLDVTAYTQVAERFEVTAVPIAVLVTPEGKVLARLANFIEPAEFLQAVRDAREAD
jgi:thioredoxin-related protein